MPPKRKNPVPKKAKWSSADDATLIATLHDERAKGNQADNSWKASTWTACEKALAGSEVKSGGAHKKASGCRDHWVLLRGQCLEVKILRNLSGWGWDDTRGVIIASDEQWATYTAQHEAAAYWRDRPFPLYEDILTLIEGRTATGDHAIHMPEMYSSSPPPEIAGITGTQEDKLYSDESEGEKASPETQVSAISTPRPVQKLARDASLHSLGGSSTTKKRRGLSGPAAVSDVASALREMATSFAAPETETHTSASAHAMTSTPARRKRAVELLTEDGDLSPRSTGKALRLFRENKGIVDTFQVIPTKELRTIYLEEELEEAAARRL
ncbi:putative myb/SANT-like DNA-binding domain containing protein [Lyophyllum shimeji]|uniref:Myb/SANT-like DNA-binding domain containing protein n=1 Tax=Lyophyllum shimeji TaxID=47721 RepID=A0A9P3Q1U4_LYOSH|nr:putative myb/SANT-like DNA-binding domain containing protein [Lyophyllum shimeji]GLB45530.1 putative myb/SANT-like DNA-binding domain containing protein [Lyophyllum shimeji]